MLWEELPGVPQYCQRGLAHNNPLPHSGPAATPTGTQPVKECTILTTTSGHGLAPVASQPSRPHRQCLGHTLGSCQHSSHSTYHLAGAQKSGGGRLLRSPTAKNAVLTTPTHMFPNAGVEGASSPGCGQPLRHRQTWNSRQHQAPVPAPALAPAAAGPGPPTPPPTPGNGGSRMRRK